MIPTIEDAQAWYPTNDPVHGFDHVLRVLRLAEKIGAAMGADMEILHAAALLHDAVGANPADESGQGERKSHEENSADFAHTILTNAGWPEERIRHVQACIRAHRYRTGHPPQSLEAKILFDADKLDVNGAFGAARTLGYAIQAGQPFYARPSTLFLETGETEPDEPHSAYHEYLFKLRRVRERLHTPIAKKLAERRHEVLTIFFEQLAAEAENTVEEL
ncbi:MAG: HD domain-containing protein [Anaerolineales bacterium]|nr:HD domain-containing protein [Anaerolineales bacterium]